VSQAFSFLVHRNPAQPEANRKIGYDAGIGIELSAERYRNRMTWILVLSGALLAVGSLRAQTAELKVVPPVMQCGDLVAAAIEMPADAALHVIAATLVENGPSAPYCRVAGTIAPEVKIEVRLPVKPGPSDS
jgi:hypothetical protein